MTLMSEEKVAGKLRICVITFEHVGDELPAHSHDAETNHITIISRGDFECTGDPRVAGEILSPGDAVDWGAGIQHGFIALTPGARIIQICK